MPLAADRFALCEECDAAVAKGAADRERRDRGERIASDFARSGLPRAYSDRITLGADAAVYEMATRTWKKSVAPYVHEDVVRAAQKLEGGVGRGLYLYGPAGSYKTSTAATLLAKQIRAGSGGRYVFVPSLFAELFSIYAARDGRSVGDVVERYATARHLVLDDLGKERPTEHAASVLMQILDARYANPRGWLIVTSNYSLDELGDRLGDGAGEAFAGPIVRRLSELCADIAMRGAA